MFSLGLSTGEGVAASWLGQLTSNAPAGTHVESRLASFWLEILDVNDVQLDDNTRGLGDIRCTRFAFSLASNSSSSLRTEPELPPIARETLCTSRRGLKS
jgi:hypothetical protein